MEPPPHLDAIARVVVEETFRIRKVLGAGLYESVYKRLLAHALCARGLDARLEVPVPLELDGIRFGIAGRIDIAVGNDFLVETKAVEAFHPMHVAQTLTYLRLTGRQLGLLINFNAVPLHTGIRRYVNVAAEAENPS